MRVLFCPEIISYVLYKTSYVLYKTHDPGGGKKAFKIKDLGGGPANLLIYIPFFNTLKSL